MATTLDACGAGDSKPWDAQRRYFLFLLGLLALNLNPHSKALLSGTALFFAHTPDGRSARGGSVGIVQIAPLLPGCCADRPFIARALAEEYERESEVKR